MIVGYVRVSTDKQTIENQKNEILRYAQSNSFFVDEFIELEISSRKSLEDRKIDILFTKLHKGDTLIASELSRIGRSIKEVLEIVEKLLKNGVEIHFIKQNMKINPNNENDMSTKIMLTMFSLFAELERDFVSHRTKEALKARKEAGVILGRKKGSTGKSKFDKDKDRIIELLELGLSATSIQKKHLKYGTPQGLSKYIREKINKDK